jgi:hypothetical protein
MVPFKAITGLSAEGGEMIATIAQVVPGRLLWYTIALTAAGIQWMRRRGVPKTTQAASQQGLRTSAATGVGVGGAVLEIHLGAWFILRSRRQRKAAAAPEEIPSLVGHGPLMDMNHRAMKKPAGYTAVDVSEAYSSWQGHELGFPAEKAAGRPDRQELP